MNEEANTTLLASVSHEDAMPFYKKPRFWVWLCSILFMVSAIALGSIITAQAKWHFIVAYETFSLAAVFSIVLGGLGLLGLLGLIVPKLVALCTKNDAHNLGEGSMSDSQERKATNGAKDDAKDSYEYLLGFFGKDGIKIIAAEKEYEGALMGAGLTSFWSGSRVPVVSMESKSIVGNTLKKLHASFFGAIKSPLSLNVMEHIVVLDAYYKRNGVAILESLKKNSYLEILGEHDRREFDDERVSEERAKSRQKGTEVETKRNAAIIAEIKRKEMEEREKKISERMVKEQAETEEKRKKEIEPKGSPLSQQDEAKAKEAERKRKETEEETKRKAEEEKKTKKATAHKAKEQVETKGSRTEEARAAYMYLKQFFSGSKGRDRFAKEEKTYKDLLSVNQLLLSTSGTPLPSAKMQDAKCRVGNELRKLHKDYFNMPLDKDLKVDGYEYEFRGFMRGLSQDVLRNIDIVDAYNKDIGDNAIFYDKDGEVSEEVRRGVIEERKAAAEDDELDGDIAEALGEHYFPARFNELVEHSVELPNEICNRRRDGDIVAVAIFDGRRHRGFYEDTLDDKEYKKMRDLERQRLEEEKKREEAAKAKKEAERKREEEKNKADEERKDREDAKKKMEEEKLYVDSKSEPQLRAELLGMLYGIFGWGQDATPASLSEDYAVRRNKVTTHFHSDKKDVQSDFSAQELPLPIINSEAKTAAERKAKAEAAELFVSMQKFLSAGGRQEQLKKTCTPFYFAILNLREWQASALLADTESISDTKEFKSGQAAVPAIISAMVQRNRSDMGKLLGPIGGALVVGVQNHVDSASFNAYLQKIDTDTEAFCERFQDVCQRYFKAYGKTITKNHNLKLQARDDELKAQDDQAREAKEKQEQEQNKKLLEQEEEKRRQEQEQRQMQMQEQELKRTDGSGTPKIIDLSSLADPLPCVQPVISLTLSATSLSSVSDNDDHKSDSPESATLSETKSGSDGEDNSDSPKTMSKSASANSLHAVVQPLSATSSDTDSEHASANISPSLSPHLLPLRLQTGDANVPLPSDVAQMQLRPSRPYAAMKI